MARRIMFFGSKGVICDEGNKLQIVYVVVRCLKLPCRIANGFREKLATSSLHFDVSISELIGAFAPGVSSLFDINKMYFYNTTNFSYNG